MIQRIIDTFYRHPLSALKRYRRFGGYYNYRKILSGRKQMEKAAFRLPPVTSDPDGLPVYFLTGKKYLYQTLFCIQSLAKVTQTRFRFILVDDGSFDTAILQQTNTLLPGVEMVTQDRIAENLKSIIPAGKYPTIHHKRQVYPHLKKLTDVHTLPGKEWKLVLDSDMLFWAEPKVIIQWLLNPDKPLYMQDCQNSYGYSKQLMQQITDNNISDLLNVGVIGINSQSINWEKLDSWIAQLEEKEGTSYYLEQALTAMLIGDTPSAVLPANEYIVNPGATAVVNRVGILHHFVDLSKEAYFKQAWKMI